MLHRLCDIALDILTSTSTRAPYYIYDVYLIFIRNYYPRNIENWINHHPPHLTPSLTLIVACSRFDPSAVYSAHITFTYILVNVCPVHSTIRVLSKHHYRIDIDWTSVRWCAQRQMDECVACRIAYFVRIVGTGKELARDGLGQRRWLLACMCMCVID
jgi:hypothetical protein